MKLTDNFLNIFGFLGILLLIGGLSSLLILYGATLYIITAMILVGTLLILYNVYKK